LVSELPKQASLSGLHQNIRNHVTGGAPLDSEFLLVNPICYKEIVDVDVLRAFAARGFAMPL
jgi:hypothetical protein